MKNTDGISQKKYEMLGRATGAMARLCGQADKMTEYKSDLEDALVGCGMEREMARKLWAQMFGEFFPRNGAFEELSVVYFGMLHKAQADAAKGGAK